MNIRHLPDESRFVFRRGDAEAEVTYRWSDDIIDILHTGVPDALAGKGVGSGLLRGLLDFARARKLSVRPLCSFAAGWIKRHPEYADLVESAGRGR